MTGDRSTGNSSRRRIGVEPIGPCIMSHWATMSTRPRPELVTAQAQRLDSWKEIAGYLNRSERTVRRWEEKEGLPVHRLVHEKRGSVYAYRAELDAWWVSRKESIDTEEPPAASEPDAAQLSLTPVLPSPEGSRTKPWLWI